MAQTIVDQWVSEITQYTITGKGKSHYIKEIGTWACPAENDLSILKGMSITQKGKIELSNGTLLLIDKGLLENNFIDFMSLAHSQGTGEHRYRIYKTTHEGVSDFTIIGNFNIVDFTPIKDMMCAVNHLIRLDMEDTGPLYELSKDNDQENLNLGYYKNEYGKIKMVFIERKKPEPGKPREYHLHETDAPRNFYKNNRYFLVE